MKRWMVALLFGLTFLAQACGYSPHAKGARDGDNGIDSGTPTVADAPADTAPSTTEAGPGIDGLASKGDEGSTISDVERDQDSLGHTNVHERGNLAKPRRPHLDEFLRRHQHRLQHRRFSHRRMGRSHSRVQR